MKPLYACVDLEDKVYIFDIEDFFAAVDEPSEEGKKDSCAVLFKNKWRFTNISGTAEEFVKDLDDFVESISNGDLNLTDGVVNNAI